LVRVPRISEDRINQSPVPGVRVNTQAPIEAFGGGQSLEAVNRATQNTGNVVINIMQEEQKKADDSALFEASSKMAQLEVDLSKKRREYVGKAALGYPDEEAKILSDRMKQIEAEIPNGRVRDRFKDVSQSYNISIQKQTNAHVFQEKERYEAESFTSFIQNEKSAIMDNFNDDDRIISGLFAQAKAIENYGQARYGDEWVKQKTNEAVSDTHIGVALQKAEIDPEMATKYYERMKEGILPEKRADLLSSIKAISDRNAKLLDLRSDYRKQQNFETLRNDVDNFTIPYAERRQKIEDAIKYGTVSTEDGNYMMKYLNGNNRQDATTYDESLRAIALAVSDVNEGINKKTKYKDVKSYLTGVKNLRKSILDENLAGRITTDDKDELIKKLNESLIDEESLATNTLKKKNDKYKFKDSHKAFLRAFNNDSVKADAAFKEYFYPIIDKQNITEAEVVETRTKAIEAVKKRYREEAIESFSKATQADVISQPSSAIKFSTPEEADSSGLPKGTIVNVGGRRYEI
jgi:hypothetical protein